MTEKFIVSGHTGYIGNHLVRFLRNLGCEVVVLGRPHDTLEYHKWRLGDAIEPAVLDGATALIHLAYDWDRPEKNYHSTNKLLSAFRASNCERFIYASSISSQENTKSEYGNVKYKTEMLFTNKDEVTLRIGLVYGGDEPGGLWALILSLLTRFPILPIVGAEKEIYPIHINDLCRAFYNVSKLKILKNRYLVASEEGIPFRRFLYLASLAELGKARRILNIPVNLAILGVICLKPIFPGLTRDRITGLAALPSVNTKEDMAALGIAETRFFSNNSQITREIAYEGYLLLRYVGGKRPDRLSIRRYVTAIKAEFNGHPLGIPRCMFATTLSASIFELTRKNLAPYGLINDRIKLCLSISEVSSLTTGSFYQYKPRNRTIVMIELIITGIREIIILPIRCVFRWVHGKR